MPVSVAILLSRGWVGDPVHTLLLLDVCDTLEAREKHEQVLNGTHKSKIKTLMSEDKADNITTGYYTKALNYSANNKNQIAFNCDVVYRLFWYLFPFYDCRSILLNVFLILFHRPQLPPPALKKKKN